MKNSYIIALAIALAAAAWLASPYVVGRAQTATGEPNATADSGKSDEKAPLKVQIRHSVAKERMHSLVLTGQTEASRQATIKAETAGRVVAVEAKEGAAVKQGDVIVRLAMDDRKARLSEAEALVKQRRIEYTAASKLSSKGFQTQTRLAETKANLEAAQARLRQIQLDIERTTIRAPFDGVVQKRSAELGDYIGIGDPVALVVDLDPLITSAQVSEREIAGVKTGHEGKVRLITGDIVDGRVRYVSSVASEGTRTFRIELEIDNPGNRLAAGLTAEIHLPVASVEAHNLSPAALTLNDAGIIGVKIVDANDIVHFRPVKLVSDGANGVWIAGLPNEADIVTVGQEYVMDGQKVTPVPEGSVPTPAEIMDKGAS